MIWIVHLKNACFWETWTPKSSWKILANTFSDSLAFLKFVFAGVNFGSYEDPRFPSHSHNYVWVMGMTIPNLFP